MELGDEIVWTSMLMRVASCVADLGIDCHGRGNIHVGIFGLDGVVVLLKPILGVAGKATVKIIFVSDLIYMSTCNRFMVKHIKYLDIADRKGVRVTKRSPKRAVRGWRVAHEKL